MSRAENDALIMRAIRDTMQSRKIPTQRIDAAVDAARRSLDDCAVGGRDLVYSTRRAVDAAILTMAGITA
ncbi:hypothetical protein [Stakelama pacifica]|uniref:Uncharacterized protein n=1 Tax=Stakelama pacifica TaxID=517720 RepID=A0A4R6FN81_9SPHN|nr:hypothetical protein [Stakelama pacifica]TDN83003.1 hypothetical protein EV664_105201 [Stakelama pacifica]GGO94957.1 hypothetical protein GCM10011329_18010 [Stakelama pacifica]